MGLLANCAEVWPVGVTSRSHEADVFDVRRRAWFLVLLPCSVLS